MAVTPDLLRRIPIFDDLLDSELEEIMGCLTEVHVAPGEVLYEEGQAAKSACFVVEGELEATRSLPGGGKTVVGTIRPGSMLGEMALVEKGTRTATVRARRPSTVLTVSYHFFHAALNQMSVPAFKILRAVIHVLIGRLDELQDQIFKQWDCDTYMPSSAQQAPKETESLPPSFTYRPFLGILPCFENFSDDEIDEVLAKGDVLEMSLRDFVHREGSAAETAYLVLRGAIERSVMRDRRYQLAVLGPGRLCGGSALIAKRPHTSDARIRSRALVLRLDSKGFEDLFSGHETSCLKFQNLIGGDQLEQLKAANNLLTQLVSQSYMSNEIKSRSL
jgi:CRP-like cAMP-binding protein